MRELLYWGVGIVARIHHAIMQLNNRFEMHLSDKQLHFLVIGLLGMAMLLVIYPLFKFLARHDREMVIAFIYVFTVIVVITFAIEIGQKLTGSGKMEFADIMYGLVGFLFMFLLFCLLRGIFRLIQKAIHRLRKKH